MYECTICHYFLKGRQVSLHMLLSEHLFFVLVNFPVFIIKLFYSTEYNSSYRSNNLKIYLICEYGGGGGREVGSGGGWVGGVGVGDKIKSVHFNN